MPSFIQIVIMIIEKSILIHIGNKYRPETQKGKSIYCGRGSPWGNPYPITSTDTRDVVCDKFDKYFEDRLKNDDEFKRQFKSLIEDIKQHKEVTLLCFCFPKRCHCLTIKRTVEAELFK